MKKPNNIEKNVVMFVVYMLENTLFVALPLKLKKIIWILVLELTYIIVFSNRLGVIF